MKSTASLVALASVLAFGCAGSSNGGGAGGAAAGGNGAVAGPPAQQATASGVKLGGDPIPKNPAAPLPNAQGNVASATQDAPANASGDPASATDPFPGEGSGISIGAGDGSCDTICHSVAGACPGVAVPDSVIHDCMDSCATALETGCVADFARLVSCAVGVGCATGDFNSDNMIAAACAQQIQSIGACDPSLTDSMGGGGSVTVQPGQGTGGTGGGVDANLAAACAQFCPLALLAGCTELGTTQDACVAACSASPASLLAIQNCATAQ